MILSVLMLSGLILSATAIAGFLVQYQIRQISDMESSAKAFFAADAALEWRTYCFWKDENVAGNSCVDGAVTPFVLQLQSPGVEGASSIALSGSSVKITASGTAAYGKVIRLLDSSFKPTSAPIP